MTMRSILPLRVLSFGALACAGALALTLASAACSNDDAPHENTTADGASPSNPPPTGDAGNNPGKPAPDGGDASQPEPDCYTNPTTHHEIINACTDASFVDKKATLPKLLADGGLPPLP